MEKYFKLKCKECGKYQIVEENNAPTKYDAYLKRIIDEENYICKKCEKIIEAKRMNYCEYCKKEFKPSDEEDYSDICQECYTFIMNEYEPTGVIKKIFEIIPSEDEFIEWSDIAKMRYGIYKLLNKKLLKN